MDPSIAFESRAYVPITVVVVTLTIVCVAVVLRTYTRAVVIRHFGSDDLCAIITLVSLSSFENLQVSSCS